PERLRERELSVLLVVTGLDEEDAEVRNRDPERRREVAEDASRDARRDSVDTEQRDGQEDDGVEQDERRQRGDQIRSCENGDRQQEERPAVADQGTRQVAVRHQVGTRVVPELVAACV